MVLIKRWDFFHVFIVGKMGKEKVSLDILEKKKRLSRLYNQGVKKRRKIGLFSKGASPWFCPQNELFSTFLFLAK